MTTPICDFVQKYADGAVLRLHMPGHKGKSFLGTEENDITEVDGADVLYMGDGIIAESQDNATKLWGSRKTLYSTEGSSLCIRAMIQLVSVFARKKGMKPKILAARNAHKTFMSGVALLDVDVEWLYPEKWDNLMACRIDAQYLDEYLSQMAEKPTAVYLTSPDYLGNTGDIGEIARVCHKRNILLMVDNAHGAYLRYLPEDKHPISLGADICCDSAHKTLPVLTGGAYLHIGPLAPDIIYDMAESAMALFSSTSPSYLILQSLDRANLYLSTDYRERLAEFVKRVDSLKRALTEKGFDLVGDEALKLTISPKSYGYTGEEIADILKSENIICEMSDPDYVVMMFTPEISAEDIETLSSALLKIARRDAIADKAPVPHMTEKVLSVREAMLSPSVLVEARDAVGEVLASASISCPPAVPILIAGERIDDNAIASFFYYGIDTIRVVRPV